MLMAGVVRHGLFHQFVGAECELFHLGPDSASPCSAGIAWLTAMEYLSISRLALRPQGGDLVRAPMNAIGAHARRGSPTSPASVDVCASVALRR